MCYNGGMNEQNIKNFMWAAVGVAVLIAGVSFWSISRSYGSSIEPSAYRSFTVSGDGKAVGVPDIATFTFSVVTQGGKDLAALQTENTEKMNDAIAYLKDQEIPEADIKTEQYSVEPRYQYYSCPATVSSICRPSEIIGYTITQSAEVKIRDFSKIGTAFSGIVSNGANSVSQLSFTVDDPAALQTEARTEAIEKAQAKAEAIAKAAGFSIGRLLSIDEGGYYPMYSSIKVMSAAGAAMEDSAVRVPTVQPGTQDITANVTLRFEIR